jgi:hypothetical protein
VHHSATYSCQLQGTRSCSQSIPPTQQVRSGRTSLRTPITGRWRQRQQKPGPPARSAHSRQPKSPPRLDRRKAFLWELLGNHVMFEGSQLPFSSALARPRLLRKAPPLSCGRPAPAYCVPHAPWRALPGECGGGVGDARSERT